MKISRLVKILICVCVLIILSSCAPKESTVTDNSVDIDVPQTKTVLIYMCGSTLESKKGAATKNIAEMLEAAISDDVNVVIETGGTSKWRKYDIKNDVLSRYIIKDNELTLAEEVPQNNMGDSSTLSDFLSWGATEYPADEYLVVMWDHGGGSIGGVCNDENYRMDSLSLTELSQALEDSKESMQGKISLVGFDACMMATIDVASTLEPYADYLAASQEIEPSEGWDYKMFLESLSEDSTDIEEVGKAICNGYKAKADKNEKGKLITMSLTDLNKFDAVRTSFDDLTKSFLQTLEQGSGTNIVSSAARLSEKYGGNTEIEGFTNLVDLSCWAEYLKSDYSKASALIESIEDTVVYTISGEGRPGAKGLSVYFPINYKQTDIEIYMKNCSFTQYDNYLKTVYEQIPETTIEFTDSGSIADDGSFQIELTKESEKYVSSVDFLLIEFDEGESGDTIGLGQDDELQSYNGNRYTSNFRGTWMALDGHMLGCTTIECNSKYTVYTAPIILNGAQTNLRFSFIEEDEQGVGGYYKLLGTWDGINEDGTASRNITPLKPGDEVTVLYNQINTGDYSKTVEKGDTFVIGEDGGAIEESPLSKSIYQYVIKIKDIFGNVFYSDTAMFKMDYSYEEILENAVPEGKYAASVYIISKDVDDDLVYGN